MNNIDIALPSLKTNIPLNIKKPWTRSVQFYRRLEKIICLKYSYISDFQPVLFRKLELSLYRVYIETDKIRTDYNRKRNYNIGRLRLRIVFYNKYNLDEEAIGAVIDANFKSRFNIVIVVDTNIKILNVRRIVKKIYKIIKRRRNKFTI